jgi:hypothetical protein
MSDNVPVFKTVLPELQDHPMFSGRHTVGIMAGGNPMVAPAISGGDHALRQLLKEQGLHHEEIDGHYSEPEHSFMVHNPTRDQMYHLGKALGQESVIFSDRGKHELLYTNGPNDKMARPAHQQYSFSPDHPFPDNWTHIPGKGYLRLYFDSENLKPAPLKSSVSIVPIKKALAAALKSALPVSSSEIRAELLHSLKKAVTAQVASRWAGAHPWHEPHPAHNHVGTLGGVMVPASYFHIGLRKDHPHGSAHGPMSPDFSGGKSVKGNPQANVAGTSKAYDKFATSFGSVDKTRPSVLKFYPMEGKGAAADALVAHHGYKTYYAGGKHGKPDLTTRHYGNGHLMVYDPENGSGGDFGDTSYTDAWRKTHELAHALTYPELNQKYGEGRRIGALGKHRTLREARRAVEWEHMAAHKQRELAAHMGIHISDEDFNREYNTIMHDALHRSVTGKFSDPQAEGFRPHSHKVPLETTMNLLNEAGRQMGLKGDHDLLGR